MVRTVCLSEEAHSVTMLRGLKQLKLEDDFCDFTIKVKNNEFRAHRVIIAAGSPYFKAMLKHDTEESRERIVVMKDVDAECVKNCIDFMYSGKFDIPDDKMGKLLHVAIMMQLDDIKEGICKILDEELKTENFYQTRSVAEMYQLSAILAKCEAYYNENFMAISDQPEFQNETKSHLVKILKSRNLMLSEKDKLTVLTRWVGDCSEKKESLLDLVKRIKLGMISKHYLRDLLRSHPVISNDFTLYKLISDPLLDDDANEEQNHGDKLMLVLFGQDADCLQSYNAATNEVSKFHEEKFSFLGGFTAVSKGSYIYVLCSNKTVHRLNYKDENSKWERMTEMIDGHGQRPPSISFSESLFVIGGSGLRQTNFVEKYIPAENKWLKLKDKPVAGASHSLTSLEESIYCIGGLKQSRSVKSFSKFTPSTSEWFDLEPLWYARYSCGVVAVDQRIYAVGGWCDLGARNEVECYDVTSSQWTLLSPMAQGLGQNIAHRVDGWIFCTPSPGACNQITKFDIANDEWSQVHIKQDGSSKVLNIWNCVWIEI